MSLSEALITTAMTLWRSLHAAALQATVSEGLAQGPYMAASLCLSDKVHSKAKMILKRYLLTWLIIFNGLQKCSKVQFYMLCC